MQKDGEDFYIILHGKYYEEVVSVFGEGFTVQYFSRIAIFIH